MLKINCKGRRTVGKASKGIKVDKNFGFLCLLGQSIVLYVCWTVLILLMGVYVYIQSHFLLLL